MSLKHYPSKRNKKSIAARNIWEKRRNSGRVAAELQLETRKKETSEEIFERLLEESRTRQSYMCLTCVNDDQGFTKRIDSDKDSDTEFQLPPLRVEPMEPDIQEDVKIVGRHIVNINHVFKELQTIANHCKVCTMGEYVFQNEVVSGIFSKWIYRCEVYYKSYVVTSDRFELKEESNDAFVWRSLSVGIGFAQAQEMMYVMKITVMGAAKFRAQQRKIEKVWEETLLNKIAQNAKEEKKLAMEKRNMINGKPYITVIGNGGWRKRFDMEMK